MLGYSTSARDALARSDIDPASVMMVRGTKVGVVCPVASGNCGWPQMSRESDLDLDMSRQRIPATCRGGPCGRRHRPWRRTTGVVCFRSDASVLMRRSQNERCYEELRIRDLCPDRDAGRDSPGDRPCAGAGAGPSLADSCHALGPCDHRRAYRSRLVVQEAVWTFCSRGYRSVERLWVTLSREWPILLDRRRRCRQNGIRSGYQGGLWELE